MLVRSAPTTLQCVLPRSPFLCQRQTEPLFCETALIFRYARLHRRSAACKEGPVTVPLKFQAMGALDQGGDTILEEIRGKFWRRKHTTPKPYYLTTRLGRFALEMI